MVFESNSIVRPHGVQNEDEKSSEGMNSKLSSQSFFLFLLTLTLRDPRDCKVAVGTHAVFAEKERWLTQSSNWPRCRVSACGRFISTNETGLLKPAYHGANGYRFYEEAQLLTLQQSCSTGAGVRAETNRTILGRADFEKVSALQSHREVLQENLALTQDVD